MHNPRLPSAADTQTSLAETPVSAYLNPVKPAYRNVNDSVYALSDALLLRRLGNRLAAQYGLRPAS